MVLWKKNPRNILNEAEMSPWDGVREAPIKNVLTKLIFKS